MKLSDFEKLVVPLALSFAAAVFVPMNEVQAANNNSETPSTATTNKDYTTKVADAFVCKTPSLSGMKDTEMVKKLLPTSVLVYNHLKDGARGQPPRGRRPPQGGPDSGEQMSAGSGVIIDSDKGYLLTNNHVVEGAENLTVNIYDPAEMDGIGEEYDVRVVGTDPESDIAVIQFVQGTPRQPCSELDNSDTVEISQPVIAIGGPRGLPLTATHGRVSGIHRKVGGTGFQEFIQTDAPINPGNSGGPLFSAVTGKVIGINAQIISGSGGSEGNGFAISSNTARAIANQLITKGEVTRGGIGAGIKEVNKEIAKKFGLEKAQGVLVTAVTPGGPAEKAGMKKGDIITMFDGHRMKRTMELLSRIADTPIGAEVGMTVWRDKKEVRLQVTLADRKTVVDQKALPPEGEENLGGQEGPFGGGVPNGQAPQKLPPRTPAPKAPYPEF